MTARDEILAAFVRLEKRTRRTEFAPAEVIADCHRVGTGYPDNTLRTEIVSRMCADDAPQHHFTVYRDLKRVDRGLYRRLTSGPVEDRFTGDGTSVTIKDRTGARSATKGRRQGDGGLISEDKVKQAVKGHLEAEGWQVKVAWGRERGIDIEATRDDERLVIEAKAEVEPQPQQVNYFLGALGELIQRMDDPEATYGLALPDNRQYRGLVERLPEEAVRRLGLVVFWVDRSGPVSVSYLIAGDQ